MKMVILTLQVLLSQTLYAQICSDEMIYALADDGTIIEKGHCTSDIDKEITLVPLELTNEGGDSDQDDAGYFEDRDHSVGLSSGTLTGTGINYRSKPKYGSDVKSGLHVGIGRISVDNDVTNTLAVELTYDVVKSRSSRIYAVVGGSLNRHITHEALPRNSDYLLKENFYNVGAGGGFETTLLRRVNFFLEIPLTYTFPTGKILKLPRVRPAIGISVDLNSKKYLKKIPKE